MEVIYNWIHDGDPEKCSISLVEYTSKSCCHCGQPIDGKAVVLTSCDGDEYLLHKECAYDGCARAADWLVIDDVFNGQG